MSEIAFDRSVHTPTIYRDMIHPELEKKLRLDDDKDVLSEQEDAKFLEQCFNDIKRVAIGDMDPSRSVINSILTDEIIDSLRNYGVFQYIGDPRNGAANQGEAFERDLARIITELLMSIDGQKIVEENVDQVMESMLSGRTSATIDRTFNARQVATMMGITVKQLAKMTNDQLSNLFTVTVDAHSGEPYYKLVGRSGVVDIDVGNNIANINYNFDPNPILDRLYNILSTATFSAKNYLVDSVARGINLGFADDIRFMGSTLSFIGLSNEQIGSLYGRTRNYQKSRKSGYDVVMTHVQHLRFAYELMGLGQSTGEAKFLIINQRLMNGSTMDILQKILGRNFYLDTMRGEIRVFSNRWLVQQMYNGLLRSNSKGNILYINNI